jgi:shikimate kinase
VSAKAEGTPNHIVFVGGMASGKSSAARALAQRLGRPLRDSDEELTEASGRTGRETAARKGVAALHRAEAAHLLHAVATTEPSVIAAAASVVENERCLEALQATDVVWLRVRPETAVRRMGGQAHRRSLGPDPIQALTTLAERRAPRYRRVADVTIDTDQLSPSDVVGRVIGRLDTHHDAPWRRWV